MYLPSFDLKNKTALITGAGRGIGRALALGYAEAGADVILLSRTEDELQAVAEEIRAKGRKAYPLPADVTSTQSIKNVFAEIEAQQLNVDILINNAGMNIRSKALDVTESEWETIVNTNMKSAFLCRKRQQNG